MPPEEEMLRRMLRIRYFDEAAIYDYDRSEIPGALHATIGQEAAVVGACMALRDDDYMTGNHRSHGHPGESGIVGAGLPIAVGAGLSAQLRDSGQVTLAFFGDGASNSGPFHESLNLASSN